MLPQNLTIKKSKNYLYVDFDEIHRCFLFDNNMRTSEIINKLNELLRNNNNGQVYIGIVMSDKKRVKLLNYSNKFKIDAYRLFKLSNIVFKNEDTMKYGDCVVCFTDDIYTS